MQHRYTPRGTTWKECPACGKEPKSTYKIGGICHDCEDLFQWALAERQRFAKLQDVMVRTLPSDPGRIKLPYCPGSSSSRSAHNQEYEAARTATAAGIYAMLDMLALATGGAAEIRRHDDRANSTNHIPRGTDGGWHAQERHRRLLIRPEHADPIDQFGPQVEIMIRCAYEAGLLDGKNLLSQLAKGVITVDSLGEADTRAAQNIQESLIRADRMKK